MANSREYTVLTATIASGTTTSSEVDLGSNYDHVYLLIPASITWNTRVFMSDRSGGTYYAAATAAGVKVDLASSVSNMYVQLTNHGRFNKIIASTAPADGASYTIVAYS